MSYLFGGIEAGGTKFICGVSDSEGVVLEEIRIPTTTPNETLAAASAFFARAQARHGPLSALAIGSFGPLSLRLTAKDHGSITSTPKAGWSGVNLLAHFRETIDAPMVLDTDVNCAAVGEFLFGSGRGLDTFCYITIGTGIGVGLLVGGAPHGGANHPEAGHIRVPRAKDDLTFEGTCPFHGDCIEGLASGPAMRARWGVPAEDLPIDHPAWGMAADYVASLCANLSYIVRPDRIIIGGGVMQPHMYGRVREALEHKLGGYDSSIRDLDLETYVTPPTAGASAGLIGALALAHHLVLRSWPMHWAIGAQHDSVLPHSKVS